ncbi:MAG: efflux RND transporter permease subunit [Candidatus Omnitrophota bacterium]
MKLTEFSIRNSLLVNLISVFIWTMGIIAMFNVNRDAFPNVSMDVLTVTTVYSGAPAEDVEKLVTIPLENEIKGVSGIKEMTSTSEEGISSIGITIEPKIKDKKQVIDDIERAVDRVTDLPAGVKDKPLVSELRTKDRPVIEVSLSGDLSEKEIRRYAESLEDQLLDIRGVSTIQRIGWRDPEVWVEVSPDKLLEYHVSIEELMAALGKRNVTLPAGQLRTPTTEFTVRVSDEFENTQEIEETVIRGNDAGVNLKVKDIARVVESFEDETRIAKVDGKKALGMVVVKSEYADVVKVVKEVKEVLGQFKSNVPGEVKLKTANDFSYYVERRLGVLISNGIMGFCLVVIVLFIFMDPIPAVMTAIGIPFALFFTFMVMSFTGMTINLVSMLGLIIVLGMLVDDGIVVSENIYRHLEKGISVKEAVVKGSHEVMWPVVASISTTWSAFLPLMFMTDMIGKFIKEVPMVVIIALAASLIEAFIFLPAHLSDFIKIKASFFENGNGKHHKEKKWIKDLLQFYRNTLSKLIDHRYKIIFTSFVLFVALLAVAATKMRVVLFGGEGLEYFYVRCEAPKGTSLERMNEMIVPIENMVAGIPKVELNSFRSYIGSIEEEGGWDPNSKRGTHLAQITVFLTPFQKRERGPQEIIESIRPQLEKIEGFDRLYFFTSKEGPPTGRSIEAGIKGEDFGILQQIAGEFKDYLKTVPGVSDVDTSYQFGKKQFRVVIDESKANQFGLTIGDVAAAVRNAIKGGVATTIKPLKADKEIEVLVRFPEDKRRDRDVFNKVLVPNNTGKLILLTAVARVEEIEGVYIIGHMDGKRVITVTGEVDGKNATSLKVNQLLQKKFEDISQRYPGYGVKYSGEFEDQLESMGNLLRSFLFALFLIFIILTAMFKSLIQPMIVMLAIPFGIVGVILAFLIHGKPLGFFAFMGLVGLAGVVVNNSIVMVDFINNLRREGHDRRSSILEACQVRLRPILMTTITTIVGLITVAYGIGGSDPFLKPMGLALVWGLFFSTLLTLFLLPCVYAMVDDIALKILHKSTVKVVPVDSQQI